MWIALVDLAVSLLYQEVGRLEILGVTRILQVVLDRVNSLMPTITDWHRSLQWRTFLGCIGLYHLRWSDRLWASGSCMGHLVRSIEVTRLLFVALDLAQSLGEVVCALPSRILFPWKLLSTSSITHVRAVREDQVLWWTLSIDIPDIVWQLILSRHLSPRYIIWTHLKKLLPLWLWVLLSPKIIWGISLIEISIWLLSSESWRFTL